MDFAVWPAFDRSWEETLALARFAEGNGYQSFWYADHMMADRADGTPDPGDAYDCWTVLAGVGAVVPRVRLVSMVSPLTIHHPAVLAKRAATVDHISGGRAVLGIGAGWQVNEHACYGFELPRPVFASRFAEGIEIIHGLLRDESTNFAGKAFTITDGPFAPKGVHGPLPILVGAKVRACCASPPATRRSGTRGATRSKPPPASPTPTPCAAEGRDPATLRTSVQAMILLSPSPAELDELGELVASPNVITGSAQELQDIIGSYVGLGFDEFAVPDFTLGDTPAERADKLAQIHDTIIRPLM